MKFAKFRMVIDAPNQGSHRFASAMTHDTHEVRPRPEPSIKDFHTHD
jgi:hypothetical protein